MEIYINMKNGTWDVPKLVSDRLLKEREFDNNRKPFPFLLFSELWRWYHKKIYVPLLSRCVLYAELDPISFSMADTRIPWKPIVLQIVFLLDLIQPVISWCCTWQTHRLMFTKKILLNQFHAFPSFSLNSCRTTLYKEYLFKGTIKVAEDVTNGKIEVVCIAFRTNWTFLTGKYLVSI